MKRRYAATLKRRLFIAHRSKGATMKEPARYSVSYGLSGCYLPDSHSGPYAFWTRRELAAFIRHEIEFYEMPKALFREVRINRLWAFIKQHGSSSAHFRLVHGGYELAFHGLTEEEFEREEYDNL